MILRFFYIKVFLSFKFTQQTSHPITIKLENCFITPGIFSHAAPLWSSPSRTLAPTSTALFLYFCQIPCKWNHVVCSLWIVLLPQCRMHLSFIYIVVCISCFYLLLSNSPSYGYTSAYLSIHQLKYLFLVFVIMDTAATNLCMQFCFCVCLFLLGRFLGESLGHRQVWLSWWPRW